MIGSLMDSPSSFPASEPKIDLTKIYRFSSSHRLHSDQLSEDDNWATYGKCNNPYGHGHNYELEVTVRGTIDRETGLVIRVDDLDRLVQRHILDRYHMRNMNLDLSEYASLVPTTENVARVIAQDLCHAWAAEFPANGVELKRVRIHETNNNIFQVNVCQSE
jgi:6-pyruvoyltetrahydropterin/6-carboxytetrahydropterin synthase